LGEKVLSAMGCRNTMRYTFASTEGLLLVGKVQNLDRNSPSVMPCGERSFIGF
jgi:hypothetical protein